MRKFQMLLFLVVLLLTTPAFAVDDFYGPQGRDSRRPDISQHRHGGHAGRSAWEESYTQDLDLSAFMERLYTVLSSPEHLGNIKEVSQAAQLLKAAGFFNLAQMHTEYSVSGDEISFLYSDAYKDLDPTTYQGQILALPNAKPLSAKYVDRDSYMLYMAVNNLPQLALIEADYLSKTLKETGGDEALSDLFGEMGGGADIGQALAMLQALQIDKAVLENFTGELGLVIYGIPDMAKMQSGEIMPADLDMALMLGLKKKDYVTSLVEQFGSQAGLKKAEGPSGWDAYVMTSEESIGMLMRDDIVVISPNLPKAIEHIKAASSGLRLDACQMYLDINMTAFHADVLEPLLKLAQSELGDKVKLPESTMAYLVDLPEPDALGHMTLMTAYEDGSRMELTMKKPVLQYCAYYLGLALCGAAQASH